MLEELPATVREIDFLRDTIAEAARQQVGDLLRYHRESLERRREDLERLLEKR